MTDRELQDLLDRLARGDGEPADAPAPEDAADWKAYRLIYAALEEEPAGDLPGDFAERVADRVMPPAAATERIPWLEWMLPPLVLIAAFVATLLLMPAVAQTGAEALQLVVDPLSSLWTQFRLDLVLTAGAALLLISFVDRFVLQQRFHRGVAPA